MVRVNPCRCRGTIVGAKVRMSSVTGNLVEGSTGNIARLTITNTSTKAGAPIAYTFALTGTISVAGYGVGVISGTITVPAGGTATKDFTFSIPSGKYGTGTAKAILMDTASSISLGSATANFTVSQAAALPPTMAESHQLPSTMYTNQTYTAKITLTNPNSSGQTYKVLVGIGCYPGAFPERCTATATSESSGGQATATIGAGQTGTISVPVYLNRYDTWASGSRGQLLVCVHVVDSRGVAQIVNHVIGVYASYPYVQKP